MQLEHQYCWNPSSRIDYTVIHEEHLIYKRKIETSWYVNTARKYTYWSTNHRFIESMFVSSSFYLWGAVQSSNKFILSFPRSRVHCIHRITIYMYRQWTAASVVMCGVIYINYNLIFSWFSYMIVFFIVELLFNSLYISLWILTEPM